MSVTYLNLVLDRSGSMTSTWSDAVGGLRQLLREQREGDGTLVVDLTVFDNDIDRLAEQVVVSDGDTTVEDAILSVSPRGSTALLDATGLAIRKAEETIEAAALKPDNVLFVVVTDGYENSSKEFKSDTLKSLIDSHPEWDFVYIGANQDAWATGSQFGFAHTLDYDASAEGTRAMYGTVSASLTSYRETGKVDLTPDAQ